MLQLLLLLLHSIPAGLRSRRDITMENLVLRHQLLVALRTNRNPDLRGPDRVLWVWVRRRGPAGGSTWSSSSRRQFSAGIGRVGGCTGVGSQTKLGQPRLSAEVRELVATMSRDNALWGTERIRGELLKLGIIASKRSIRRYRWRKPTPAGSQRWTFLGNERRGIWAADLLVVHTINYRVLYVFFFISHERRELVHFNVTASHAAVYGKDLGSRTANLGIASVKTPPRSPKANAITERLVRTIRSEVLDHVIVISERHLLAVLSEFAGYYNRDRPHRSLNLQSPLARPTVCQGSVVSRAVLGGLHHVYARAA